MKGSKSAHARTNPRTAKEGQQQHGQPANREGARSAFAYISTKPYRERKDEVTRNLKDLEEDNARLQDFMKKLNVLMEKVKHNGALIKQNIVTECDNLVKIIEKRKRTMLSQVDKEQYLKVRELEGQMTYCRRLFSTGHSVIVRTNRDLENLSMPTFMKKSDTLISDIDCAIRDQPVLRPAEDDKYDIEVDLTEQRESLDRMELKGRDSSEDRNNTAGKKEGDSNEDRSHTAGKSESRGQSRDTHKGQSPRDSKGATKRKPLIQKLVEEDEARERKERQTRGGTPKTSKQKEQKKTKGKKEMKKEESIESDAMNGKDVTLEQEGAKREERNEMPPKETDKDENKRKEEESTPPSGQQTTSAQDLQDERGYEDEKFEQSDQEEPEQPKEEKVQSQSEPTTDEKAIKDDEVQSSIYEEIESIPAPENAKKSSRTSVSSLSASEKERKISDSRNSVGGSKRSVQKGTEEGVVVDDNGGVEQIAEESNVGGDADSTSGNTKSADQ